MKSIFAGSLVVAVAACSTAGKQMEALSGAEQPIENVARDADH